ncbi:MAG: EAL domain-containing protein [gamma proteobacterium endosymbiont of Lamellibrachia anaximandri]|nr:EAL domain-containing protein [gamma proteobacterium endosymbiont of Lamellibrachia anaximandri]
MNEPQVRIGDCLCPNWQRVDAYSRYSEVAESSGSRVFAVFSEEEQALGLVTERQAALFPTRIFADLLLRRQPPPVGVEAPILEVLQRMDQEGEDYLLVVDAEDNFCGVVSRLSIITTLVDRESQLRGDLERLLEDYSQELEHHRIAAAVFEATSEGIMVTDAEQRIVLVNRAFCGTTGYSVEEALGQTPHLLHSGQHDAAYYAEMWRSLRETGAWEGEIWNRRKNGEIYPEWLHINAIPDDQGKAGYYAGVFSDATHHQEMRERLHYLAYHDALTGLPNRQLFLDRLSQAVAQARRGEAGLTLLFIDLDGFKEINDTLGHPVGDQLLIQVGEALRHSIRESDTLARLGGDEFTVVTGAEEDAGIITITEKLLVALNRSFNVAGHELFISASVGISRYPGDGDSPDSLLIAADSAMYDAKKEGRGGFRFYSASNHLHFREQVDMSRDLRHALEEGDITLDWQPQVDIASGEVVGMEALARWTRPDGETVSPAVFVPLAERTGLIGELGRYVLRLAAREAAGLSVCGNGECLRFAINFSPFQVDSRHGGIQSGDVLTILAEEGLAAERVELELTETAIATHREGMSVILQELGEAGICIAVDDFGTGCSNLATIKRLPVHKLKLDRSLVSDLTDNPTDREIASAVIGMARALNLEVLAEGVETAEQAHILADLGCRLAQGYHYGRPMPMTQIYDWLDCRKGGCRGKAG